MLDPTVLKTHRRKPESAVGLALAHNPEVEAAAHQLEKARAAVRAARAEYIPEISAFAQHIYQDGAPFLSRNNGAFGMRMTWTMFEFGKRRGQVSEREAEVAQAEENLATSQKPGSDRCGKSGSEAESRRNRDCFGPGTVNYKHGGAPGRLGSG